MRLLIILLLCLAVQVTGTQAQTKRSKKKRTAPVPSRRDTLDLDGLIESLPPAIEEKRGWRLAVISTLQLQPQVERTNVYYDRSRVVRRSGVIRLWVKYVIERNGEDTLEHTLSLEEFDCAERRTRTLSVTRYSKAGAVLPTISTDERWSYVTPDTLSEGVQDIVCFGHRDTEEVNRSVAQDLFGTGLDLERQGDYQGALDLFVSALEFAPHSYLLREARDRVKAKLPAPRAKPVTIPIP
ncbi:MAG: hypothetical protein M3416_03795 [Acidobacteriota bacterium]|nr:hypothetical protein [Acidobacteriota bacterium]